jgi:transcriptional regulator with XRE-family HTH domain
MRIEIDQILLRLGLAVRTRRSALKLTQTDLAKRARISAAHLSGIERGQRSASILCLARIAKALRTTMEKLCEAIDEGTRQPRR